MPSELMAAEYLRSAGIPYSVHEHVALSRPEEYALAGFNYATSAKTLAFSVPSGALLVAIPGPARLNYGLLARAVDIPRARIRPADGPLLAKLGMKPGGVCPFIEPGLSRTVLDSSLFEFPRIFCGSGDPCFTIELSPTVLGQACPDATVASVIDEV